MPTNTHSEVTLVHQRETPCQNVASQNGSGDSQQSMSETTDKHNLRNAHLRSRASQEAVLAKAHTARSQLVRKSPDIIRTTSERKTNCCLAKLPLLNQERFGHEYISKQFAVASLQHPPNTQAVSRPHHFVLFTKTIGMSPSTQPPVQRQHTHTHTSEVVC